MLLSVLQKLSGSAATESKSSSGLRVAVPSWGIPGVRIVTEEVEYEKTSRAELESLFQAELAASSMSPDDAAPRFTKEEQYEMLVTSKLRDALYSDKEAA